MKKIILFLLLILAPAMLSLSCGGYVANPYSSVSIGVSGGPYGPIVHPTVRTGIYYGGYYR